MATMQAMPPQTAVQPSPIRSATVPPRSSPTRGPPATTTMEPPPHPVGRGRLQDRRAEYGAHGIRRPGERHRDQRAAERLRRREPATGAEQADPEADDADRPAADAHHDRQALAAHRAEPPGG